MLQVLNHLSKATLSDPQRGKRPREHAVGVTQLSGGLAAGGCDSRRKAPEPRTQAGA